MLTCRVCGNDYNDMKEEKCPYCGDDNKVN